ncbi:villin-2-like [Arachis ipaensis]|uniref:villin-2-like n=1 Tax=Arachis ipaensis TaxID=130454 RepID=UPI000A2B7327|nr:villin-2-like [Arachis ipaensis]
MGKHTGISSECAVPTDSRDSILIQKQKSINAQVVIGTPGTIKKWISFKKLNLTRLTILVFDEADQMHAELNNYIYLNVLLLSATFNDIVKNFVERTIYQFNGANSIKIYGYDVFILDSQNKIYQFNRANSNIQERAKALEVIQYLKKKYHEGKCNVAIVDDGKLDTESDSDEFWVLFGGFAPIGKKVVSDEDIIPETTPAQLFRFYQQMLVLGMCIYFVLLLNELLET